jgi:hypothetical protein
LSLAIEGQIGLEILNPICRTFDVVDLLGHLISVFGDKLIASAFELLLFLMNVALTLVLLYFGDHH